MKFCEWIRNWWEREVKFRDQWLKEQRSISTQANISSSIVYATQFAANTTREVALPDQYVKFANIGWWNKIPDTVKPYYSNYPYTVNLRCKKTGQPEYWAYNVTVREAGPWNKNDNYWDSATASNPRRKFTDLPLGIPEAERAYLQNYNNGKDEYGRTVLNPAGIDLSFSVASELNLGYLENIKMVEKNIKRLNILQKFLVMMINLLEHKNKLKFKKNGALIIGKIIKLELKMKFKRVFIQ